MKSVVFTSPEQIINWRKEKNQSVGFVPTMGALHEGHAALLKKARLENEIVVLSIFINPTQFNDKKDLENYPVTWESDVALAEKNGVDVIFYPSYESLYPDQYHYKLVENSLSQKLCGNSRPGHFDGVLTVVMKLLNLVQPTRAYFGEKDHQQLSLIDGMVKAFFLNSQIIPVPTVRETSGLAMSSRNSRLSPEQKKLAPEIHRNLVNAKDAEEVRRQLEHQGIKVDYVEELNGRRYVAAQIGDVRLIDNVEI